MTCKDCLHWDACKSMLESMGVTVDGDGADADKKCDEFTAAADYKRVVRGRWIGGKYLCDVYGYEKTCSNCQREYVVGFDYAFCPYCGANMRCGSCEHYGWDMPQCKVCNASNHFKWYKKKDGDKNGDHN